MLSSVFYMANLDLVRDLPFNGDEIMAILLEVKWVDQSEHVPAHQRIRHIGGNSGRLRWKHTQAEAIESIESSLFSYYFKVKGRASRLRVGLTADGQKFLTMEDDGDGRLQFLFELPTFPIALARATSV
jgi:hypothetical protein